MAQVTEAVLARDGNITAGELANELGVSTRLVQRCLDQLSGTVIVPHASGGDLHYTRVAQG